MSRVKTRKVGTITVTMRYHRRKGWILTSGVRRSGREGEGGKKTPDPRIPPTLSGAGKLHCTCSGTVLCM